jgi:hypothetical protein
MSARATFFALAAERVPRWSSTGNASPRLDKCSQLLATPLSSQKAIVIGAQAKPISQTSRRNHPTATSPSLVPTPIAAVKSP